MLYFVLWYVQGLLSNKYTSPHMTIVSRAHYYHIYIGRHDWKKRNTHNNDIFWTSLITMNIIMRTNAEKKLWKFEFHQSFLMNVFLMYEIDKNGKDIYEMIYVKNITANFILLILNWKMATPIMKFCLKKKKKTSLTFSPP